jgi:hypothetical protein
MQNDSAVKTLSGIRFAVGLAAWVAPRLSGKGLGLNPHANPQAPYLGRLFGARDVALAVGTVQAEGEARQQWLRIGVAVDVADALAAIAAGRAGYLSKVSAALVFAPAVTGVALGLSALRAGDDAALVPA